MNARWIVCVLLIGGVALAGTAQNDLRLAQRLSARGLDKMAGELLDQMVKSNDAERQRAGRFGKALVTKQEAQIAAFRFILALETGAEPPFSRETVIELYKSAIPEIEGYVKTQGAGSDSAFLLAETLQEYAEFLSHRGRVAEAVEFADRAAMLDPAPVRLFVLANSLELDDRMGEATDVLRLAMRQDPDLDFVSNWFYGAVSLARLGQTDEAIEAIERILLNPPNQSWGWLNAQDFSVWATSVAGNRFEDLPEGAKVGTSSLRRTCQIRAWRPDLKILDLRGNVNTRLRKLDEGEYDAIILACAGLKRLGFDDRIREHLDPSFSLPAIGQGAVGIECRVDDEFINNLIAPLNHAATRTRVLAERAMNNRLEGGCQVPIGGYAELDGETLLIRGLVGRPDGSEMVRGEIAGKAEEAEFLGTTLADDLLSRGAGVILKEVYDNA